MPHAATERRLLVVLQGNRDQVDGAEGGPQDPRTRLLLLFDRLPPPGQDWLISNAEFAAGIFIAVDDRAPGRRAVTRLQAPVAGAASFVENRSPLPRQVLIPGVGST